MNNASPSPACPRRAGWCCRTSPSASSPATRTPSAAGRPRRCGPAGRSAESAGRRPCANVSSVPPFCTNACSALTPSAPKPLRNSAGVLSGLPPNPPPPPPPPAGRRTLAGHRRDRIRGQDDRVVLGFEVAGLELGVHERLERHVELLEHQARPAFVHVAAAVALIHRDARLAQRDTRRSSPPPSPRRSRRRSASRSRATSPGATRKSPALTLPSATGLAGAAHRDALVEQQERGAEAVVQPAIEHVAVRRRRGDRAGQRHLRRQLVRSAVIFSPIGSLRTPMNSPNVSVDMSYGRIGLPSRSRV